MSEKLFFAVFLDFSLKQSALQRTMALQIGFCVVVIFVCCCFVSIVFCVPQCTLALGVSCQCLTCV